MLSQQDHSVKEINQSPIRSAYDKEEIAYHLDSHNKIDIKGAHNKIDIKGSPSPVQKREFKMSEKSLSEAKHVRQSAF